MVIAIDKNIRFGKPVIDGTRITVGEILGSLAGGMTPKKIIEEYGVTGEEIKEALRYASEIISEERIISKK